MGGGSSQPKLHYLLHVGSTWGDGWVVQRIMQYPRALDNKEGRAGRTVITANNLHGAVLEIKRDGQSRVLKFCNFREAQAYWLDGVQRHRECFPVIWEAGRCGAVDADQGFVVMEMFAATLLRRQPITGPCRMGAVAANVILALRVLHQESRIVHADVAPDNIGLRTYGTAVLFDFGHCQQIPCALMSTQYPSRCMYASIAQHRRLDQPLHPVDDLQALLFVVMEQLLLLAGSELPWSRIRTPGLQHGLSKPHAPCTLLSRESEIADMKQTAVQQLALESPVAPWSLLTDLQRKVLHAWFVSTNDASIDRTVPDLPADYYSKLIQACDVLS